MSIPVELRRVLNPRILWGVIASTKPSSSLRLALHSTGKNSTRWPDCSWNLGKHFVKICDTFSRMILAFRPIVPSSMMPPTPWTMNTAWVTSGSLSAALQTSLYPLKILYPVKGRGWSYRLSVNEAAIFKHQNYKVYPQSWTRVMIFGWLELVLIDSALIHYRRLVIMHKIMDTI